MKKLILSFCGAGAMLAFGASTLAADAPAIWTSADGNITVMAVPVENVWSVDAPSSPACGTIEDFDPGTQCCRFDFPTCDTAVGDYSPGDAVRFNTYWTENWQGGRYQAQWSLGVVPNGSSNPLILFDNEVVDFGNVDAGNVGFCVSAVVQAPQVPGRVNPILEGFAAQTPTGSIPPNGCNSFNIR